MKIPSDFITATGEIHDWEAPMKTLGQIAQEAFDAAPHDHTKTFDKQDWWEAAAQAVRAAVIEECAKVCDEFVADPDTTDEIARAIRSLK